VDISKARLQHIHWTEQVISALKKGQLPEISNHHECELGKWLHTQQNESKPSNKTLETLKRKHQRFHETVSEMINFLEIKDYDNAEILLGEFRRGSKDVVFLLSQLEYDKSDKSEL